MNVCNVRAAIDYNNREVECQLTVQQQNQRRRTIERIALGSDRAAKIMAVRASVARVAEIDAAWRTPVSSRARENRRARNAA